MLADRPRAWLAFADLQTPFFPLEEFVEKKILWGFCGHLSEVISGDLTQPRARRFRLKLRKEQAKEVTAHSRVQAPVVQKADRATLRITYYPVDRAIGFGNTYRLENELSGEERYPTFERPGPSLTEPRTSTQGPGWIAS